MNVQSFRITRPQLAQSVSSSSTTQTEQRPSYMMDQNAINNAFQYNQQNSKLNEAWNKIDNAFDPTDLFSALNDVNSYNTSKGQQVANNAAAEFATRANLSGGSAAGAGVVRGQVLMPFLESNAKNRLSVEGAAADMRAQAVGMMADIGKAMDSIRLSYAQGLVSSTLQNNQLGQQDQQFYDELEYRTQSDADQLRNQRLIAAAQIAAQIPTTREAYNIATGQTIPAGSNITPFSGTFGIPKPAPQIGYRTVAQTTPELAALLAQLS